MLEIEQFFEDYKIGAERLTGGRTITETDIVMHAMHSGDFYPDIFLEKIKLDLSKIRKIEDYHYDHIKCRHQGQMHRYFLLNYL